MSPNICILFWNTISKLKGSNLMFHGWFLTIFCSFSKRPPYYIETKHKYKQMFRQVSSSIFPWLVRKKRISMKLVSRQNRRLKNRTKKFPANTLGYKQLTPRAFFRNERLIPWDISDKKRLIPWVIFDKKWLAPQEIFPSKFDIWYVFTFSYFHWLNVL